LTELEQFYIANSPITTENFFREIKLSSPFYAERNELNWANFNKLYDVEIYNCPNLTALPMEMLANLPELQMLNIASNRGISGIQLKKDWEAFIDGLSGPKIQVIYMGYNNLEEFPKHEDLKKMVRLGMLDCVHNKVKKVHPFGKEINFTKLYLDYNEITEIPHAEDGYFFGYSDVETFTCTHNKITTFPDIFNAKSVYIMGSLDFSYNQISSFENGDNFRGVNTGQLNLSNNHLTQFPGILFKKESPIYYLILAGNGMTEIPEGSMEGKNAYLLEAIDLSYNKLTKLSDDFYATTLPYLTGIDLSYNSFSKFPTAPLSIGTLQQFHIRHQRDDEGNRCLREWPTGLHTCPSLMYFTIGSNDLRKINDTISPNILVFEIKDNPNISIDLSAVCDYISIGYYLLIYDKTQDIRGCDILDLEE
jgi:Leucine-rich repeat (LRR) protein